MPPCIIGEMEDYFLSIYKTELALNITFRQGQCINFKTEILMLSVILIPYLGHWNIVITAILISAATHRHLLPRSYMDTETMKHSNYYNIIIGCSL